MPLTVNWQSAYLSLGSVSPTTTKLGWVCSYLAGLTTDVGLPIGSAEVEFAINTTPPSRFSRTTNGNGQAHVEGCPWVSTGTNEVTASASVFSGSLPATNNLTYTVGPAPTVSISARVEGAEVSPGVSLLASGLLLARYM